MPQIETPCIKVCIIEPRSGTCMGCGRTLAEVAGWTSFSDAERSRIMTELPQRRESTRRQAAAEAS